MKPHTTKRRGPTKLDAPMPREYLDGFKAFVSEGKDESFCPYPRGHHSRGIWFDGWLDGRTWSRLGHVFERLQVEWP